MLALHWIALAVTNIGALNWGLVGLFNIDLVASLFGPMSLVSRLVYVVVGVAGVIVAFTADRRDESSGYVTTRV